MSVLRAQALTPAAFAAYGTVLAVPEGATGRPINGGSAQRFDLLGDLALGNAGGRAALAIFRAQARTFPYSADVLERHACGSQTFVPLGLRRFVLVVGRPGEAPASASLAAFVTDGAQGVTLAPGTWHHALLAIDSGDFVVVERVADAPDCDLCHLAQPVQVVLAP